MQNGNVGILQKNEIWNLAQQQNCEKTHYATCWITGWKKLI